MQPILIAPSILSADFAHLAEQVKLVEQGGADWLHIDVMDGHFVPNITIGPPVVASLRKVTNLPLDTHLMIESPELYLEAFQKAGANSLTVHVETCPNLHRTIQRIKELGMRAGVTLNPSTPPLAIREVLTDVDLVLVMTVNPGFGGQKFIRSMLPKIREIRSYAEHLNANVMIEVDGGVDERNARELVEAGATALVAGNSIFSQPGIAAAVRNLRAAATREREFLV